MDEMTLNEYQDLAAETAMYPGAKTGNVTALSYIGLGLGEAGEVQGKLKKVIRDDNGVLTAEKREAIAAELGDVLWYVAMLSTEIGYGLNDIAKQNVGKLSDRLERGVISGSGDNR